MTERKPFTVTFTRTQLLTMLDERLRFLAKVADATTTMIARAKTETDPTGPFYQADRICSKQMQLATVESAIVRTQTVRDSLAGSSESFTLTLDELNALGLRLDYYFC